MTDSKPERPVHASSFHQGQTRLTEQLTRNTRRPPTPWTRRREFFRRPRDRPQECQAEAQAPAGARATGRPSLTRPDRRATGEWRCPPPERPRPPQEIRKRAAKKGARSPTQQSSAPRSTRSARLIDASAPTASRGHLRGRPRPAGMRPRNPAPRACNRNPTASPRPTWTARSLQSTTLAQMDSMRQIVRDREADYCGTFRAAIHCTSPTPNSASWLQGADRGANGKKFQFTEPRGAARRS